MRNSYRLAIIAGDGIGQEIMPHALRVLDVIQQKLPYTFEYVPLHAGWDTYEIKGNALPPATIRGLNSCDAGIFGTITTPMTSVPGFSSPIVNIRRKLDMFAQISHFKSSPVGLFPSRPGIDMTIIRENTEEVYIKQEMMEEQPDGRVAIALRRISEKHSLRIARYALELASKRRRKLTIVHKANVLGVTDGLFRDSCFWARKEFPDVDCYEMLLDSFVYKVQRDPTPFDVVVAPNLYGYVLMNVVAPLVGGLGLVGSLNYGKSYLLAQPLHGTGPDIIGSNSANPIAIIRSVAMLLEKLIPDKGAISRAIYNSVDLTLNDGKYLTPDLGGSSTTNQTTDEIIKYLEIELSKLSTPEDPDILPRDFA